MRKIFQLLVREFKEWRDTQDLMHGLVQLFIAVDQLLNVLTNPFSKNTWADESISSRCGRLGHRYPYKFWRFVIDNLLFGWWQGPNHCVNAYRKELTRYHFHPAMRNQPPPEPPNKEPSTFS